MPRSIQHSNAAVLACPISSVLACPISSKAAVLACPISSIRPLGRTVFGVDLSAWLACPFLMSGAVLSAWLACPFLNAQTPPTAPTTPATVAATTPPATNLGGYRLPLLREGSVIARVDGDLAQDPDEKIWVFRPRTPESTGLRREFVLMPSPTLEDMLHTVRMSPSPVEFEVTGRVFIYRGRNFLLPDLAPPIVRFDTAVGDTPKPTTQAAITPSGDAKFVPPVKRVTSTDADDAAVEDIERRLEQRVGRVPTSSGAGAQGTSEPKALGAPPVASGTRLAMRRGRLSRDPQVGTWRFVPEQITGNGDASIELLPCLLLEKLELAARESDSPPVVLLSGTVYGFEGKSYLLSSSFRRAREGRGLGG
jgi:hypothetical protein